VTWRASFTCPWLPATARPATARARFHRAGDSDDGAAKQARTGAGAGAAGAVTLRGGTGRGGGGMLVDPAAVAAAEAVRTNAAKRVPGLNKPAAAPALSKIAASLGMAWQMFAYHVTT
jgi:hypothetical protein